jgi:hypothetical protein
MLRVYIGYLLWEVSEDMGDEYNLRENSKLHLFQMNNLIPGKLAKERGN